MHKSKWAGNILGNNFDNDIVFKDVFSDNLTKGKKYGETHVFNSKKSKDKSTELKNMRLKDMYRVMIGNLNIYTLPIKLTQLQEIVLKHVDIVILTKSNLDYSFPTSQFIIDGFSMPYPQDRNRNRGGIMI